jgi:hypothetical protein
MMDRRILPAGNRSLTASFVIRNRAPWSIPAKNTIVCILWLTKWNRYGYSMG